MAIKKDMLDDLLAGRGPKAVFSKDGLSAGRGSDLHRPSHPQFAGFPVLERPEARRRPTRLLTQVRHPVNSLCQIDITERRTAQFRTECKHASFSSDPAFVSNNARADRACT